MTGEAATVYVVDDDPAMRAALHGLLRSVGLQVVACDSARSFLETPRAEGPACLVLDIRMPGQSGLDLQTELNQLRDDIPIIFITGHGDIPMSVRAMKGGAIEFLPKPFREQDLLDAIHVGLERDRRRLEVLSLDSGLAAKFQALSPREREIMACVVSGKLNKQIAATLDLSEITVKVHRANVMRKMGADSLADLVRMADRLRLAPPTT
jgi:FixJ family two-component response regulator